ncbi:enoyl-CoA hydratase/isomerase family protein [Fodinicola feengrottensis]|uniref:Enoyl-CoA hydratase/isomerase family protein n=1 Tax=Fodinicola feengrottensis TaxID=435914 RepID=A0ABN2G003_9ACTN|nr:enoyl-CoA hydratase/isomerase family protein [Fodinicola feengrottensis]
MIETTEQDGIAVLQLDHGPVNALDLELLSALPLALASVAEASAVVLTGAGRCFSAGVDLKRIVDGGAAYVAEFLPALTVAASALFGHPKPVVAAVNGHALAGGCVLAVACDVRLMSAGTIGLTELAVGVPFPTVPMEIMRHGVGPVTSRLVLTADRLDPATAQSMGVIDEVVAPADLLPTALARAGRLAAVPAEVYALSKRQLQRPALDRIAAVQPVDDPVVLAQWSSPATHDLLLTFMENLSRR